MDKFSYVGTSDVNAIESLFLQYNQDPNSVDASWRDFFKGFEFARTSYESEGGTIPENVTKEFKVLSLIYGYRQRGHLFTKTNPVRQRRTYEPTLALENFSLSDKDLEKHGKQTKGVVFQKWKSKNEWLLKCSFKIGYKEYETFSITDKENKYQIGDTLTIRYSSETPDNNEIIELK